MSQIHLDEPDLAHIMSVNIGAAHSCVPRAAARLNISVRKLPVVEAIYPEVPARAFAIDEADLCKLLRLFSAHRPKATTLDEILPQLTQLDGKPRPTQRVGSVLRLSAPFFRETVA